ncbi:recombination protein NinG [Tenacibaculum sp. 190524A02b]|uniref:recombination protein NinG n=1 Tax=Tenacibaculum vairaonense TaxID=3137860 RepID=UPI0031FB0948
MESNIYQNKTIAYLIKEATRYFNAYIRKRDSENNFFKCISCSKFKKINLLQAGHYLNAKQNPAVRFDERNVNGQCIDCNCHLEGNVDNYRKKLIEKIGLDQVEGLEALNNYYKKIPFKWCKIDLIEVIEKYKSKLKDFD